MEREDLRNLPEGVEKVYCAAPGKLIGGEMVPVSMCLNCRVGECESFIVLVINGKEKRVYLPKTLPSGLTARIDRPTPQPVNR